MVPHHGTNWAALRLTSQIGRDAVLSESYGRGCRYFLPQPKAPPSPTPIPPVTGPNTDSRLPNADAGYPKPTRNRDRQTPTPDYPRNATGKTVYVLGNLWRKQNADKVLVPSHGPALK